MASGEARFIDRLRALALDPAARGLLDDAAVLEAADALVLTHDMLVEGVHFLPTDPPGDVAWKLVAVNLSDLAGKGARPRGVLLGYGLRGDDAWDAAFVEGLAYALEAMAVPLLGGDTVGLPDGPRILSLTAVGDAPRGGAPSRSGAMAGDAIWVSGTVGDAGPGLLIAQRKAIARGAAGPGALLGRYRRPMPRVALGELIAGYVSAMMDVSDGLLIDCARLAEASGVAAVIDLDAVPLSSAYRDHAGDGRDARLAAVAAGDDYELLLTAPVGVAAILEACGQAAGVPLTRIGAVAAGRGLSLRDAVGPVPLPDRLGYEHG